MVLWNVHPSKFMIYAKKEKEKKTLQIQIKLKRSSSGYTLGVVALGVLSRYHRDISYVISR